MSNAPDSLDAEAARAAGVGQMIQCTACGAIIASRAIYCGYCSAAMTLLGSTAGRLIQCRACDKSISSSALYCGYCGENLTAQVSANALAYGSLGRPYPAKTPDRHWPVSGIIASILVAILCVVLRVIVVERRSSQAPPAPLQVATAHEELKTVVNLPPMKQEAGKELLWDYSQETPTLPEIAESTKQKLRNLLGPLIGHENDMYFGPEIAGSFYSGQGPNTQFAYSVSIPWTALDERSHVDGDWSFLVIATGEHLDYYDISQYGDRLLKVVSRTSPNSDAILVSADWSGQGEEDISLRLLSVANGSVVLLGSSGPAFTNDCASDAPTGIVADRVIYSVASDGAIKILPSEHVKSPCPSTAEANAMPVARDRPTNDVQSSNQTVSERQDGTEEQTQIQTAGLTSAADAGKHNSSPMSMTSAQPAMHPPTLIYSVDPKLSDAASAAKFGGRCVVRITIDTSGRVSDARVIRPLGMGLDLEAITAVRQYRFEPAMLNGRAIATTVNVEFNFKVQ